ncbi:MAG: HAMP domain-containing protein [Anaerolineaceae bacterium]|nr:MAG: HAMP domain-containing protein [Anaerolineaceae bacterium]
MTIKAAYPHHQPSEDGAAKPWLSLRVKLLFSHLAVIFLAMTVAAFLLLSLVRNYFLETIEQSLTAQAHLIAQALIPGASVDLTPADLAPAYNTVQQRMFENISVQVAEQSELDDSETSPSLQESKLAHIAEASVQLSTALETHVRVLDDRGIVLLDTKEDDLGQDLSSEDAVLTALRGDQHSELNILNGEEWLFVSVPVSVDDQVAGVIYLSQPLNDIAIVLSDLRNRFLLASALALPLSALVGLVLARTISRPVQSLTDAAKQLSVGDFDYPLETTGGDELGRLSRTFAAMRDRLQSVERMRSQFVSDVSHELRTPLTSIKGLVETLRDGAVDDPEVRDRFLTSVESETDRLIRLVNDLLILSRADAQALNLPRELVDLTQVIHETLKKLGPQMESLGIGLREEPCDAPLTVQAEPDRIEQILVILLDNAIKYTPSGGEIHVSGDTFEVDENGVVLPETIDPHGTFDAPPHSMGKWVVVSISDTGAGIPPEDLPHIFERFYRADHSRSRDRGGSGLGLSIAKALIEAYDGHIWLTSPSAISKSNSDRPGTTARFSMPFHDQ